jgi:hypothetical protein
MAVQPKDQPTGNDDRAQDENRKGERAVWKKRIYQVAEHFGWLLVIADYVFSGKYVSRRRPTMARLMAAREWTMRISASCTAIVVYLGLGHSSRAVAQVDQSAF